MNARPWLRLYREVLTDRKIARITKATGQPKAVIIGFWTTLLCLAAGSDRPGVLWLGADIPLTYEDLADESGLDVALAQTLVEEMIALQMLTREADGTLLITHWQERQFDSDISTPRVQRSRQRRTSPESATDETPYATHHGPGETFHVTRPTDETPHATHPGEDETFHVTHSAEGETFHVTYPAEGETLHVTRRAKSAESETLENQNQIQNQKQNQRQNQTTTAESEQHQTQTKRRVAAAVVAVDNFVDNSHDVVDPAAAESPVAGTGAAARWAVPDTGGVRSAAGDEATASGDKRVDGALMPRAQAPPDAETVWPVAGDSACHPAWDAPDSRHDARAAPHDDAYAAYTARAAARSAYDAQAAVDAVWRAADADAEAEAVHDARAAPDVDSRAAGDAPAEDRAGQVHARLRDLAAQWDVNRAQARDDLIALGVEASMAEQLAREHPPQLVRAWCAYTRKQTGLHNPAGFVVQRITRGLRAPANPEPPPKRWYTDEEYERFFKK